jgi:hypothetical protein
MPRSLPLHRPGTDVARRVAFDPRAPKDERVDALGELQKAHAPKSLADMLLPSAEIKPVIDFILNDLEQQDLNKSLASNVVPFPSKNAKEKQRGMQSVRLDDLQITHMAEYWEKPSAFSFASMREMVAQTPILNAIVLTRVRQVQRFCNINESGEGPGFTIRHVDKDHQATPPEKESMRLLGKFMANCGWEFRPRERKKLYRDAFPQFMAKLVRDSLTMDSAPVETEMRRNKDLGIDGFYSVDGETIRLCTEQGYDGDDEIFAVQVVQGRISAAYNFDQLIYEPRNPVSSVLAAGYGLAEPELLIRVVTGFLNALTYNIKGFDQNSIPKGVLHLAGDYDANDLSAFRRFWNAQVRGINNAWTMPVMVSKDAESKAQFETFGEQFNEMHFSKWMTFLASIACAIYGMSPAEINFDSFTGGNTSALAGSDTEEKLAASKDSGLRPVLSYFQNQFTDYVISSFSDKYCFRWTGLDDEDAEKREERARLVLTVDEVRAQEGYDKYPGDFGGAPLNPALVSVWSQMQQAAQQPQEDFGDDGSGSGAAPGGPKGGPQGESGQPGGVPPGGQPGAPGGASPGGPGEKAQLDDESGQDLGKSHTSVVGLGLPSV